MERNLNSLANNPANTAQKGGAVSLIVWFVVIFFITLLILWLLKPTFVLQRTIDGVLTSSIDWGRTIFISLIIALIIVVIVYFLYSKK